MVYCRLHTQRCTVHTQRYTELCTVYILKDVLYILKDEYPDVQFLEHSERYIQLQNTI